MNLVPNLQFALLIKVEDSFFKVVHLTEHQSLIKHSVVAPQERHSFHLQHLLSLPKKNGRTIEHKQTSFTANLRSALEKLGAKLHSHFCIYHARLCRVLD